MQALKDTHLELADTDNIILIRHDNDTMPLLREFVTTIMGKEEPDYGIGPMEAVEMRAGIQTGIISGDASTVFLFNKKLC